MSYYNDLNTLESAIDTTTLLAFCQTNRVETIQQEDGLCHCFINGEGSWSAELDAYSAMVFGVHQYLEHQKKSLNLLQ